MQIFFDIIELLNINIHYPKVIFLYLSSWAYRLFVTIANIVFTLFYSFRYRNTLPPIEDEIIKLSACELAILIRKKQVRCETVVRSFVRRSQNVNQILNCISISRYDAAINEAKAIDNYLMQDNISVDELSTRKPLLGVPFTVKDSIAVEGMLQTIGLKSLANNKTVGDADVVIRMREAGAILIAKTNVSEGCLSWDSYNMVHGRTKNAYDLFRTAGGSSSGEAALIAAGGSPIGIGSDIAGSIRLPCFFNGIFGLKPSPHVISNAGHLPSTSGKISSYLVVGPLSKYCCDIEIMYRVLSRSINSTTDLHTSYSSIKRLKIFQLKSYDSVLYGSSINEDLQNAQTTLIQRLESVYDIKVGTIKVRCLHEQLNFWIQTMRNDPDYKSAAEVIGIKNTLTGVVIELMKSLAGFSNLTLSSTSIALIDKLLISDPRVKNKIEHMKKQLERVLGSNGVMFYPSHSSVAPYHYQPIVNIFNISYTAIFNVLELPVIQVPLGIGSKGVPLGIQIVAAKGRDDLCLAFARHVERIAGGWIPP